VKASLKLTFCRRCGPGRRVANVVRFPVLAGADPEFAPHPIGVSVVLHAVDSDGRIHVLGHEDGAVLVRQPVHRPVVVLGDALGDRAAQVQQERLVVDGFSTTTPAMHGRYFVRS